MPNTELLDSLVAKHADTLAGARAAAASRQFFSAYPEMPSPKEYGDDAAADGQQAFDARRGARFDLGQPDDGTWVGGEHSPYGFDLDVTYAHAGVDQLIEAAQTAMPEWRFSQPAHRAAVAMEILSRLNARSFEMSHAVMHTSGQAWMMAFQAGGPHAQDRGLESVVYALDEQERCAREVLWEKPQGKRPPLRMVKEFTPVSRGIGLVIACNTFPTWNTYPGLFASLATGNAVIVKPHPRAVLPVAITVQVAREVLAEAGFDPNLVLLAPEADGELIAGHLATRPEVGIVDFTGSNEFGRWLEDNARQAQVFTEKAGVNSIVFESTDSYAAALGNIAFTLSLYSGQMCTTTQNIYVPADGIETDDGRKSPEDFGADLGAALDKLLADDEKAANFLGAIVNDAVLDRLVDAAEGSVAVPSKNVGVEAWPHATIRTPLVRIVDHTDRGTYAAECFGPVTNIVATPDRSTAVETFASVTREKGAITAGVYSTDDAFLATMRRASAESFVALSENLCGGVFVNQTAAFSDFHATGGNPAANATYCDGAFVSSRFRVVETRRHAPEAP